MCIVALFLAEMFCYVAAFPKYQASQVMAAVFSFLYAPVLLSFVYLTRECENGIYLVWLILISSWGCDTCAYVVGKLIGKKHIFPELSPHKSLEGCIGGVAGAALIGGLYAHFFVEAAFPDQIITWTIAFICAAGAVMSMVGDLAASAIKRNHNIKDYGKLIPGHGGIMDRFDSMTVTAPMTYFLALVSSLYAIREISHNGTARNTLPKLNVASAMASNTMPLSKRVQNISYSSFRPPYLLSL